MVPTIFKQQTHYEDQIIGKEQKKIFKFMAQKKAKYLKLKHAEELYQLESSLPILNLKRPVASLKFQSHLSLKNQLLSNSILLFADIFSSNQLNIKNKLQLIKHFIVHTSPP